MKQLVDWFVKAMDSTELSFVTLLSKIVPLFVPVIPAYVGYRHVTNPKLLNFDPFFGWVYALVIEGLGYAAIYKAVAFWEHNKKYTEGSPNRAPLKVAIGIYIVYLVVTLAVNVVLDWVSGIVWYNVLAIGLISILSVPAGLLMSISAIHTERENERATKKEVRASGTTSGTRLSKPLLKVTSRTPASRTTSVTNPQPMGFQKSQPSETTFKTGRPSIHQDRVYGYMDKVYQDENRVASFAEVERDLELPQSTASRLRNSWVEKNTQK